MRGDCLDGPRPCPWTSCKWHLAVDNRRGTPPESCALDVADRGGVTLEVVGKILNLTRERVRQIEFSAIRKLKANGGESLLSLASEALADPPRPPRRRKRRAALPRRPVAGFEEVQDRGRGAAAGVLHDEPLDLGETGNGRLEGAFASGALHAPNSAPVASELLAHAASVSPSGGNLVQASP